MGNKTLKIDNLGSIDLFKRRGNRNMVITVKSYNRVRVTMPFWTPYGAALDFVRKNSDWIRNKQNEKRPLSQLSLFEDSELKLRDRSFRFRSGNFKKPSIRIGNGIIEILYPESLSVHSDEIRKITASAYIRGLRIEAKEHLSERVKILSLRYGFKYKKLSFKNVHSLWGSCSVSNNINLSIHLMRLPQDLIDYVIVHELAHTKEKNHGTSFWNLVKNFYKNPRAYEKRLAGIKLRHPFL